MVRFLLASLLVVGCGTIGLEEPNRCIPNHNDYQPINDRHICFDSIRCHNRGLVLYSSYLCICSGNCLCFLSINKDCDGLDGKDCEKIHGGLFLFGDGFCEMTPEDRTLFLQLLNQQTQELLKGK